MDKKGVEMSMQVIVVAVVVLLIAAILIYLASSKLGLFGKSVGDCTSKGGVCKRACDPGEQWYGVGTCQNDERCCIGEGFLNPGR